MVQDAAQAFGSRYRGRAIGADPRPHHVLVLPHEEPRWVRRRRDDRDAVRGTGGATSGCCGLTARPASTSTTWSARTAGSTRCRRRCCRSGCHGSTRLWRPEPVSPPTYDRGVDGICPESRCPPVARSPTGRSTSTSSASAGSQRDADPGRARGARRRYRRALPAAAASAGRARRTSATDEGDFPEAEAASREVVSLPIFRTMRDEECAHVVSSLAELLTEVSVA